MKREPFRFRRRSITGGADCGSHLCERLLSDGNDVVCVDNYFTGVKDNIAHLMDNPRFEVMRHDVTFPLYVEVDEIYNLACPASPVHYQHDPVQTTKTSVHGAINLLGLQNVCGQKLRRRPVKSMATRKFTPSTILLGKHESDRTARVLRRRQAVRRNPVLRLLAPARTAHQSCRIFNTYGPVCIPMTAGGVEFIVQALRGEDITIYGDGSQTRSFAMWMTWSRRSCAAWMPMTISQGLEHRQSRRIHHP